MMRFLFLRLILPLIIFWFIRGLIRTLLAGNSKPVARRDPPKVPSGGELKKDPVCGTFIPVQTAVTKTVDGQLLHFCSAACRDKYQRA